MRTIDLDKNVCERILSLREGSNMIIVVTLLAFLALLIIEGGILISKTKIFEFVVKNLQIYLK